MKTIPAKIKIYGHWIDVIEKKEFIESKNPAAFNTAELKIKIISDQCFSQRIQSLLHETVEGIKEFNKLSIKHPIISTLGAILFGVFNNNKFDFNKDISNNAIKISGCLYCIVQEDEFIESEFHWQLNYKDQEIQIVKNIAISIKHVSLIGAIIWTINSECEMDLTQQEVRILAEGLYLFMTENNIDFRHEGKI